MSHLTSVQPRLTCPLGASTGLVFAIAVALSACGGGGSDDGAGGASPITATVSPLAGFWAGDVPGGKRMSGVVLPDGAAFMPYDDADGLIDGLIHGHSSVSGNSVSAHDLVDWNWASLTPFTATMTGSYGTQQIAATVEHTFWGAFPLTLTRVAGYDTPAAMADFQGDWSGAVVQPDVYLPAAAAAFTADGELSGRAPNGCAYTGQLALREERKAVLNIAVSFQGAACGGLPTQAGVAWLDPAKRLLTIAVIGENRSTASVARLLRGGALGLAAADAHKVVAAMRQAVPPRE